MVAEYSFDGLGITEISLCKRIQTNLSSINFQSERRGIEGSESGHLRFVLILGTGRTAHMTYGSLYFEPIIMKHTIPVYKSPSTSELSTLPLNTDHTAAGTFSQT